MNTENILKAVEAAQFVVGFARELGADLSQVLNLIEAAEAEGRDLEASDIEIFINEMSTAIDHLEEVVENMEG